MKNKRKVKVKEIDLMHTGFTFTGKILSEALELSL